MMGQFGSTPLHRAAIYGLTEIASLLLGNGADIHSKNNVSILVYICNYMIYINTNLIIIKYHYLYMMGQGGRTPLHYAAYNGLTETASLLISNGADVHSKDNVSILVYICN